MGLPSLTGEHRRTVTAVNTIVEHMCDLIMVMHRLGKDWCVENPVQRSDVTGSWKRYFSAKFEMHGSLWQMPCMVELMRATGAVVTNMPMCFFDPDGPQKYTTVLISKGLAAAASSMTRVRCTHDKHKKIAVGLEHSRASQVYPSSFCEAWARVMRWPDDAGACKAVLSHLALGAEANVAPAFGSSGTVAHADGPLSTVTLEPVSYSDYVEAARRHRLGTPEPYDEVTLSWALP
jgi:hypothetical protein